MYLRIKYKAQKMKRSYWLKKLGRERERVKKRGHEKISESAQPGEISIMKNFKSM